MVLVLLCSSNLPPSYEAIITKLYNACYSMILVLCSSHLPPGYEATAVGVRICIPHSLASWGDAVHWRK